MLDADVRLRGTSAHSNRFVPSRHDDRKRTARVQPGYQNDATSDIDHSSRLSHNSSKPIIPPPPQPAERFAGNNTQRDQETTSVRSQRRFSFSVVRVPRPVSRDPTSKRGQSIGTQPFQSNPLNLSAAPALVPVKNHRSKKPSTKAMKVIQTRVRPKK